jgi:hypothetical protein
MRREARAALPVFFFIIWFFLGYLLLGQPVNVIKSSILQDDLWQENLTIRKLIPSGTGRIHISLNDINHLIPESNINHYLCNSLLNCHIIAYCFPTPQPPF